MRITFSNFRWIIAIGVSLYTISIAIIFLGFKDTWHPKELRKIYHQEIQVLPDDDEEEEMYENYNQNTPYPDSNIERPTTFQKVGEIYIFSVYLDNRPHIKSTIRIISLKRLNSSQKTRCAFKYNEGWLNVNAQEYEMCENHGRLYGGWMYFCEVPQQLVDNVFSLQIRLFYHNALNEYVPVNITSYTKNNESVSLQPVDKIGVCVPPLFGDISLSMLLQFLELGKIQGIQHFTFYLYDVKDSIRKILHHYQQKGEVTLIEWILPENISPREIWYNGQMLAIQDCLYRNMARTIFLGFLDLDEFIIPTEFLRLTDLLKSYESESINISNISAFSFQSAFFDPKQLPDPSQQLKLLQLLKRNSKLSKLRTKLLTVPQNVLELGVHHVSKALSDSTQVISVNPDIAKIHHYRACIMNFEPDMTCYRDVMDDAILKYSDELIHNYKEAVKSSLHLFVPETEIYKHDKNSVQ